jgi:two-component system sensor histidine kinase/response regulator
VLVVDDDATAGALFGQMLGHFGMFPEVCADGETGLIRLREAQAAGQPFEMVLVDWLMPGIDGLETTRRIHQEIGAEHIPAVLMITGSYDKLIPQLGNAGVRQALAKPVSESTLHDALVEALQGKPIDETQRRQIRRDKPRNFDALRGARVLLVEDVRLNREVATAFLRQTGVEVEIAVNGLEAVAKVGANAYDLVLMDIQMPEMDGLTATQEIRKDVRHAELPILAMTAHAMSGDRERSLAAGMNDHLTKPINANALFDALLQWIKPRPADHRQRVSSAPHESTQSLATTGEIPALDGIDTQCGLANHIEDADFYCQSLTSFLDEFGNAASDIETAMATGDLILARRIAHSTKSTAAMIGANVLSAHAKALEQCFAAESPGHDEFAAYREALALVAKSLREFLSKE